MAQLARCLLFAVGLLGGLGAVAHAAVQTVTLGVPERLLPEAPMQATALDTSVSGLMGALSCRGPDCPRRLALQVNIALGSDYEILDWFGKGLLDLAVVPGATSYLLRREDLRFVEFTAGSAESPRPISVGDVEQIERFSRWIWCEARARGLTGWEAALLMLDGGSPAANPSCKDHEPGRNRYELQLTSHLQDFAAAVAAAAPWLVARIGPWSCTAAPSGAARAIVEDRFWNEFLVHTRFTLGGSAPPGRSGATPIRLTAGPPTDRLIVTQAVARRLGLAGAPSRAHLTLPAAAAALWGRSCPDRLDSHKQVPHVPRPFAPFLLTEPAFGVRTFAFSPFESIDLLRLHKARGSRVRRPEGADEESKAELALVLPGGGVKAAYQTALIERLYSRGLLQNARGAPREELGRPLGVDYVIGTSGGALIGYFVARLTGTGPWDLEKTLWQSCTADGCRDMRSTDIFGYIDMPRYLSAVAMLIVFAVMLYVGRLSPRAEPTKAAGGFRIRFLLTLLPALLVIPWLIRYVNGDRAREHVPEVEGLAYAAVVLLAMFADQCLMLGEDEVPPWSRVWRVLSAILCAAGGAAVVGPALLIKIKGEDALPWLYNPLTLPLTVFDRSLTIQRGALMVCLGGVVLLAGIIVGTRQSRGYRFVTVRGFIAGLVVGLLQIALASAGVIAIVTLWPVGLWPFGYVSLLELTSDYWLALAMASVAAGFVLLGVRQLHALAPPADWIARGVNYLSSGHSNGGRRLVRLSLLAAIAIGWWNVVLAPGVYGNALALQFLRDTDRRFVDRHPNARPLRVPLIMTANVLDVDGARYFAFLPTPEDCLNVTRRSGYGATWLKLWPDGSPARPHGPGGASDCGAESREEQRTGARWKDEDLRDVVFASGSPYPVFPAHGVKGAGRLVDGGYANNVPIDAAQAVGADQVLIVASTNPLGHEASPGWLGVLLAAVRIQGDLVDNLPRLFTFLYERSQEIDRISRRELLVVSLAPPREEAGWPNLVQFTGPVIQRMRNVAEADWETGRRIGMVQSWGRPRFAYTVMFRGTLPLARP